MHPLSKTVKRRDKILRSCNTVPPGPITGTTVSALTSRILRKLPAGCQYGAVYLSLTPLIGTTPTQDQWKAVAGAMAGNYKSLKTNEPVYPPKIPTKASPVYLQFLASAKIPPSDLNPAPRTKYRLKIVGGKGCPLTVEVIWADKFVRYIATRPNGFGFARPPRGEKPPTGRPFQHPATLVGMLIKADIGFGESGKLEITNPRCPPAFKEYNKALTEMRFRVGFKCPYQYTHACQVCPRGQNSCPAACHPADYVEKYCPRCRTNAKFDTAFSSFTCVRCSALPKQKQKH